MEVEFQKFSEPALLKPFAELGGVQAAVLRPGLGSPYAKRRQDDR